MLSLLWLEILAAVLSELTDTSEEEDEEEENTLLLSIDEAGEETDTLLLSVDAEEDTVCEQPVVKTARLIRKAQICVL